MVHSSAASGRAERRNARTRAQTGRCVVTGQELSTRGLLPVALLRPSLADILKREIGDYAPDAMISRSEVERLRTRHISELLMAERGELGALEKEVVESLARNDVLTENIESEIDDRRTIGEQLSDKLASFGGSWGFLIVFAVFIAVWMLINLLWASRTFDPYPFILLNLVLSCIAAVQAPVIMMSQKRQEAKDRLRSLNDYRVNLKAELEVRHLHEKIDHILTRQWDRLAEMQELQIELLQEIEALQQTRQAG